VADPAERVTHDTVALVTGAGRGIGREIALALARDGARVALLGRTRATLEDAAAACASAGAAATAVLPADVTDRAAVGEAVEAVARELGPVDLLVANAGVRERAPAQPWAADPDDWWQVVETNLRGVFLVDQAVVPGMIERGRGRVLHLGAAWASVPVPSGRRTPSRRRRSRASPTPSPPRWPAPA